MASELSRQELAMAISEIVNTDDPFKVKPYAEAIMAHDAALRQHVEELEYQLKQARLHELGG